MKTTDQTSTPIADAIARIARIRSESPVKAIRAAGQANVPTAARSFDSGAFTAQKRAFWRAHASAIAASRNRSASDDIRQGNSGNLLDTNTTASTPTTIMWNCPDACYLGDDIA